MVVRKDYRPAGALKRGKGRSADAGGVHKEVSWKRKKEKMLGLCGKLYL